MNYTDKKANSLIERLVLIKGVKKAIMEKAQLRVAFYDSKANKLIRQLQEIQSKCKHHFPNKPNPVMGRGICDICGYDDY